MRCCQATMNARAKHAPNGTLMIRHWCDRCGGETFSVYDRQGAWIVTDPDLHDEWRGWEDEDNWRDEDSA